MKEKSIQLMLVILKMIVRLILVKYPRTDIIIRDAQRESKKIQTLKKRIKNVKK